MKKANVETLFPSWVYQFSFGLYGLMLTLALIGLIVMVLLSAHPVGCISWEELEAGIYEE